MTVQCHKLLYRSLINLRLYLYVLVECVITQRLVKIMSSEDEHKDGNPADGLQLARLQTKLEFQTAFNGNAV